MSYNGQFYLGSNASGTLADYLQLNQTYTISFTVDTTTYPYSTYPNHWFVLSTADGSGYVNICGNGAFLNNNTTWKYNGGNSSYDISKNLMSTTFYLPSANIQLDEHYGQPFTLQTGNFRLKAYCANSNYNQVIEMKSQSVALVINFAITTDILPNKIIGKSGQNTTVVVTETTSNNQTLTYQTQSNAQGIWSFNVSVPSNLFSFAPLNVSDTVTTVSSNYSFRYPRSSYKFTSNNPILIKPRQNGINSQDQRSWRISPKLPEGLKFSSTRGTISGTPTKIAPSTTYTIWSNSEVFLGYKRQLIIEII